MNLYWPEHPLRRLWSSPARQRAKKVARWERAALEANKVLLLAHGHCLDGVGSAIVTRRTLEGVHVLYVQPNDMQAVLERIASTGSRGRRLLIADLSLQKEQYMGIVEACRRLKGNGWSIEWRDHHHKQWEGLDLAQLTGVIDKLEVNKDATESGASLQQQALAPNDNWLRRLAETIRDRDLWWNKAPDSETLEFALTRLGPKEFQRLYEEHQPTDPAIDPVVLPAAAAAAKEEREEQVAVRTKILQNTRYFGAGDRKVGIAYGWLPKNTGLHELIEEHGCAVAVNVRPNGKASLRSRRDAPVCHRIANRFMGGGHPNASGADLGLTGPAYWWYVVRRGHVPVVQRLAQACEEELARGPDPGA